MESKHTPTPYAIADVFIYAKGNAQVESKPLFGTKGLSKTDQEFIVRACNAIGAIEGEINLSELPAAVSFYNDEGRQLRQSNDDLVAALTEALFHVSRLGAFVPKDVQLPSKLQTDKWNSALAKAKAGAQ